MNWQNKVLGDTWKSDFGKCLSLSILFTFPLWFIVSRIGSLIAGLFFPIALWMWLSTKSIEDGQER